MNYLQIVLAIITLRTYYCSITDVMFVNLYGKIYTYVRLLFAKSYFVIEYFSRAIFLKDEHIFFLQRRNHFYANEMIQCLESI